MHNLIIDLFFIIFFTGLMQERMFEAETFNDEIAILGLAGLKQVS